MTLPFMIMTGDQIPLIGRIIACADAYDAMATRRCYKDVVSDEAIIAEFQRCSGTHFDPALADIVIECIRNGEFPAIVKGYFAELEAEEERTIRDSSREKNRHRLFRYNGSEKRSESVCLLPAFLLWKRGGLLLLSWGRRAFGSASEQPLASGRVNRYTSSVKKGKSMLASIRAGACLFLYNLADGGLIKRIPTAKL